ncbi:chondroitinase-B domain-containing protein [Vibrio alfacsensis]|uniref:chondroitinase-B domain-containing protein n=1 Tax=Vibrio alfacsensis TaxID=1074311 RepID=UPI0040689BB0
MDNASKGRFVHNIKIYLFISGVALHLVLFVITIVGVKAFLYSGPTLASASINVGAKIQREYPSIIPIGNALVTFGEHFRTDDYFWREFNPKYWPTVGPKDGLSYTEVVPKSFSARTIFVSTTEDLTRSIKQAQPGDVIVVKNGNYYFQQKRIKVSKIVPTEDKPIYLVAENSGKVNISLNSREGLYVDQPYWRIIGFNFKGVCKSQSWCDHAFHIVGNGAHFYAAHNTFSDFNAAIKINRLKGRYPDNGRLEYNHFLFTQPRHVKNSVTPINLDHGDNWLTSRNIIRDFSKTGGNKISYGLFYKGGVTGGQISNNLVICNTKKLRPTTALVGISIGGGGMPVNRRRDSVDYEADNVVVKNNIVMHCNDVGLYVNKGKNSYIHNNIFYNTFGLDLRFPQTSGKVFNNVLNGKLRHRENASSLVFNNKIMSLDYFTGENKMQEIYRSPSIGNFSIIDADSLVIDPMQELNLVNKKDFCDKDSGEIYMAGAVQSNSFCFE